jgi:hypothetical protein
MVRRVIRQEMAELCDPLDSDPNEEVVYKFKYEYVDECEDITTRRRVRDMRKQATT